MKRRSWILFLLSATVIAASAMAQDQETFPPMREAPDPQLVASMPAIAEGLGVKCNYCHLARRGMRVPEPKKDIARAMIAMTKDINLKIQDASGKSAGEAAQVQCVTCHRGVAIPGQLIDILMKTAAENGAPAAIAQYRDLRERYYGRGAYDFGEETLMTLAQRLSYRNPDEAIPVFQLNLEIYPKSARTYSLLATAYARKMDEKSAIATLEKALEVEPENSMIKGQLAQLKSYKRNRQ